MLDEFAKRKTDAFQISRGDDFLVDDAVRGVEVDCENALNVSVVVLVDAVLVEERCRFENDLVVAERSLKSACSDFTGVPDGSYRVLGHAAVDERHGRGGIQIRNGWKLGNHCCGKVFVVEDVTPAE